MGGGDTRIRGDAVRGGTRENEFLILQKVSGVGFRPVQLSKTHF